MPITAQMLRNVMAEARPIIERQMNDAKIIAGFRDLIASNGGDWSALKALIKAHVEDEADDDGDGKRVRKILDKADSSTAYADMLGLANMNENNFSDEIHQSDRGGSNPDLNPSAAHGAGASAALIQGSVGRDYSAGSNATASLASDESEAPHSHSSASSSLTQTDQADGVTPPAPSAAHRATDDDFEPVAFLRKPAVLRPDCQHPDNCAGYGAHTCHACKSTASARESVEA